MATQIYNGGGREDTEPWVRGMTLEMAAKRTWPLQGKCNLMDTRTIQGILGFHGKYRTKQNTFFCGVVLGNRGKRYSDMLFGVSLIWVLNYEKWGSEDLII